MATLVLAGSALLAGAVFAGTALHATVRSRVFLALILLVSQIALRPFIPGEAFGFLGLTFQAYLTVRLWRTTPRIYRKAIVTVSISVACYWLSITLVSLVTTREPNISDTVKALFGDIAAFAGGACLSSNRNLLRTAHRILSWLVSSQIVAYLLMLVLRTVAPTLATGPLLSFTLSSIGGRASLYEIWAPFAITQGSGGFVPQLGPRLTGFGGEPGVLAALMALLAVFPLQRPGKRRIFVLPWYTLGIIFTQSTGGMAALAVGSCCLLLLRLPGRYVPFGITLAAFSAQSVVASYSSSMFGLNSKASTNNISVQDRLGGSWGAHSLVDLWLRYPFGDSSHHLAQESINLLTQSITYGPIPPAIALAAMILPCLPLRMGLEVAPIISCLVVTLVAAQPAFENPAWLYLLGFGLAALHFERSRGSIATAAGTPRGLSGPSRTAVPLGASRETVDKRIASAH